MKCTIIGVGEFAAAKKPGTVIRTLGLGSCVALVVLDPVTRTVGMAHIALPDSSVDPRKGSILPAYFADQGVPALLGHMGKLGVDVRNGKMIVKLAGGATIMDDTGKFNIGKRNVLAIKKWLWKYGMGPIAEDVGGKQSRSVEVEVDTGKVTVSASNGRKWTI